MDGSLEQVLPAAGEVVAGRWVITQKVSSGSSFTVYDARGVADNSEVTLKCVNPALAAPVGFDQRLDVAMQRATAVSHPGLVAVFDWGSEPTPAGRRSFIVTEPIEAGSLRDVLDRGRRLTPSQALAVGLDVCRALAEAHSHGVVHGEITPSKILFGADGKPRLADLGPARVLAEPFWVDPAGIDNHVAAYASPEQVDGAPPGAPSDVYALALVLVEAVTGSVPFDAGSTTATLAARVDRLLPVGAELGPLAAPLERAARPDPSDRADAVEMGTALLDVARRLPRPEPIQVSARSIPRVARATPEDEITIVTTDDVSGSCAPSEPDDARVASEAHVAPAATNSTSESGHTPTPVSDASDDVVASPDVSVPVEAVDHADAGHGQPSMRRRPRWLLPVIAALVVVLGVLGLRWALVTPEHTMPELIGVEESAALNQIAPFSWEVEIVRQRSDDMPEAGTVMATSPVAGINVAEGGLIRLEVSAGPLLRELPEVTGLDASVAIAALSEAGLAPYEERLANEVVPVGEVISWDVPGDMTVRAGSRVEPGTVLRIVVSSGPAPRIVPDLAGQQVGAARADLVDIGLRIATVASVYDDVVPEGEIVSQDPPAGESVERGTTVDVTVSLGVEVLTFPSLATDIDYSTARQILTDAGFDVELVLGASDGIVESITVDDEPVSAGDEFPPGTTVQITAV